MAYINDKIIRTVCVLSTVLDHIDNLGGHSHLGPSVLR